MNDQLTLWMQELESKHVRKMTMNIRKLKVAKAAADADTIGPFFTVSHYAGDVVYDAYGFLEKNRDTLSRNVVSIMKRSSNELVSTLFKTSLNRHGSLNASKAERKKTRRGSKDNNKLSVSAMFKESLLDLMRKMQLANPHFIR